MEMEKGEKGKERDSTSSIRPALVVDSGSTILLEPSEVIPSGVPREWSTSLSSCNNDEETTWWGFWCCCLLQARTAQSFEVDSSKRQIKQFCCYIVMIVISALIFPLLTSVVAAIGGVLLAVNRAKLRWAIRRKLNISGSFASDFAIHCCCPSCAVCQEAREEKAVLTRTLDFCSGEDLLVQERAHQRAIGHGEGISDPAIPEVRNQFVSPKENSCLNVLLSSAQTVFPFLFFCRVEIFLLT